MPAREISTTIKLDGEKAFNAALREAQREMRVMASDLKAAAAEFEFAGDKQQLLTAKSRTLRDEIAQQDKIVVALTQSVKDSAEKYGDASKQTDGYRIKLSNATATLFKLKQQLAETDREAEELGRDSTRVGRQIKDGIGDAAEDASESLDDMIQKLSSDVGSLKSSAAFSVATNIATWVTGSIGQINDFVEGTRDYRNKRALAQSAVEEALNLSEEEYNNLFMRIVGLTNDSDGANEAITTLAKSGIKSYQEMLTVVDIMMGLYTQFGEEARPEAFAESWQETNATGKMAGKLQELAERQRIDPEMVDKAMESAPQEDRVQILANAFAGTGGMQSLKNYRQKNAPLIRENESVAELEIAQAELAEAAAPITAKANEVLAEATARVAEGVKENIAPAPAHWLKRVFIPDVSDWTGAGDSTTEAPEEKGKADAEAYTDAVETTITDKIPTMQEITEAFLSGGDEAVQSLIDSRVMSDEDKAELLNMLKELGLTSGTNFDDALNKAMVDAAQNADISGANIGTAIKNSLDSTMPLAVASLRGYVGEMLDAYASLSAGLNTRVASPRIPGQPTTAGTPANGTGSTTAVFMVNDREFARGVLPAINSMQGRSVTRMQTIT